MKAKMTDYKGVYFRSRLEARWCQFFEYLGISFEYEPEAKQTNLGRYVPDFYFRSVRTWVEIKGKRATKEELQKLKDVCINTNKCGLIISGYPKTYPHGVEPHLANSSCYFISKKGNEVYLSLDFIFQAVRNGRAMQLLSKCKAESIVGLNFSELKRYKELKPAKAKFYSNKDNIKDDLKFLCEIFKITEMRLDKELTGIDY